MPTIAWIIILAAIGLVLGSLFMLRDTANSMPLSEEKLAKIRQRQAELEAQEQQDND
ncbi:DUF2897 family protein [Marinobacter sp. X15-166B]|uniref:DUF2897 family protein n=1 Tax=Marinobacter sp. X15-166B TaxID=1897620 RepID=UPI00085C29F2|nr:DUF2897 family protein [Marinobacter sp. X15-166B]OEY67876.1 DUF2897 domain-containing protein [Marinobacter sp. X15-166B]